MIDAATRQALGQIGGDFERQAAIAIRGRGQPQEVYRLALND